MITIKFYKMKYQLFLVFIILFSAGIKAQEDKQGRLSIGFAAGPSFANMVNSEAPHKINLYGSDEFPVVIKTDDVEKSVAYTDYKTSLTKDILYGVSLRFQFEYYLYNNLSINGGLSYNKKGINMKYSNNRNGYLVFNKSFKNINSSGSIYEELNSKIVNHYICFPIAIKYHPFRNNNFFIQGGFYLGKLILNKTDIELIKDYSSEYSSNYYMSYINGVDYRDLTNEIDYGLIFGGGFFKKLNQKLIFTTEVKLDIGLKKLDAKYNNEYEEIKIPSGTNIPYTAITSTNYHGFNSNAKNISAAILIGINYIL